MKDTRFSSWLSALRFALAWRSPPNGFAEVEVSIPLADGSSIRGTVVRARGSPARGWVILHGLTPRGLAHTELRRFNHALAAAGMTVLVPEIREWTRLDFAPIRAQEILRAAVDWLAGRPGIAPGGVSLMGVSFGAPQALAAAADPALAAKLRAVVGWGGYADIERTFRFSFTGEHEWDGVAYRQPPDPYVRWIVGANCLPHATGLDDRGTVAPALRRLAIRAGKQEFEAWNASSDPAKAEIRSTLPAADRALYDLFAPPAAGEPDRRASETIVSELVRAARRSIPLIEPLPGIGRLALPARLLHARADQVIPFTETLRTADWLGSRCDSLSTRLTGLFTHSGEDIDESLWRRGLSNLDFLGALTGVFEAAG